MNYEDILDSYPECEDGLWRLYHIWYQINGKKQTFTVSDVDGNHERLYKRDADKLLNSIPDKWKEYYNWVLKNDCKDPLNQIRVRTDVLSKSKVVIVFRSWIGVHAHGMRVETLRVNGKPVDRKSVDENILKYADLENSMGNLCAPWAKNYEEAKAYVVHGKVTKIRSGFRVSFVLESRKPRSEKAIKRDRLKILKKNS